MDNVKCIGCGKCCNKHWLLRLTSEYEKSLFTNQLVYNDFIWTDECQYNVNNKCSIHENKPSRCKEYYCEEHFN